MYDVPKSVMMIVRRFFSFSSDELLSRNITVFY